MKILFFSFGISIFVLIVPFLDFPSVIQSLSRVWLCNLLDCSISGFPVLRHLLESAQTLVHWWCHPAISSSVIPFTCPQFPSIRIFSHELALLIRWPESWSLNFSISPSNEYSGLISFRIDWFDLLTVQGTLKSLLQYHSSKASVLQHSTCYMVQLSHLYITIGKTIALIIQTFVSKVMSLPFNMLSRFVLAFLPWGHWSCQVLESS